MSQKSSVPQAAKSVSQVLMSDKGGLPLEQRYPEAIAAAKELYAPQDREASQPQEN